MIKTILAIEMKYVLYFFLIYGLCFSSCKNDPEVITKTVRDTLTIQDTVIILDTIIQIDTITQIDTLITTLEDTATTFILVRHAEKDSVGSDPGLTPEGIDRAIELSRILKNTPLKVVYSSNFNRTLQTAQPSADSMGLGITLYNPSALNGFANQVLEDDHSHIVLVVGHSNTTPDLINILIGQNLYSDIPENEYDNLFIVNVFEKGRAKVIHLKYGK